MTPDEIKTYLTTKVGNKGIVGRSLLRVCNEKELRIIYKIFSRNNNNFKDYMFLSHITRKDKYFYRKAEKVYQERLKENI